jgi:hypothetical protein
MLPVEGQAVCITCTEWPTIPALPIQDITLLTASTPTQGNGMNTMTPGELAQSVMNSLLVYVFTPS